MKTYEEVNCSEKRERSLAIQLFSQGGDLNDSSGTQGPWRYIAPDSPISSITSIVFSGIYAETVPSNGYPVEVIAKSAFDVIDDNGAVRKPPHR